MDGTELLAPLQQALSLVAQNIYEGWSLSVSISTVSYPVEDTHISVHQFGTTIGPVDAVNYWSGPTIVQMPVPWKMMAAVLNVTPVQLPYSFMQNLTPEDQLSAAQAVWGQFLGVLQCTEGYPSSGGVAVSHDLDGLMGAMTFVANPPAGVKSPNAIVSFMGHVWGTNDYPDPPPSGYALPPAPNPEGALFIDQRVKPVLSATPAVSVASSVSWTKPK